MTEYFIFAGEKSGDLHGGHLIRSLRKQDLASHFMGVGGPAMRAEGLTGILKMEDFQVMGFSDVLKSLPQLWKQFYLVRDAILKTQPTCVILIDYPGFNLRLAQALRKKHFKGKIIQYICPSVWAHGRKRINTMVQNLDLVLTIYPFETDCFKHTSLKVVYIGNPLVENIHHYIYDQNWYEKIALPLSDELVALFPGSRSGEIIRNLPQQLIAANLLKKLNPQIHFALSYAHEDLLQPIHNLIQQSPLKLNQDIFLVPQNYTYELMRDCRTALAKSGTVTLELALHSRPSVIVYQLSQLNYFIAKYLLRLKLPHYCIVNILGGKEVFPELIGKNIPVQQLYEELDRLHYHEKIRAKIIEGCQHVRSLLGNKQTHQLAAQAIQDVLC